MKCEYCGKEIFKAYWQGKVMAREFTERGSKIHECEHRDIKSKLTALTGGKGK